MKKHILFFVAMMLLVTATKANPVDVQTAKKVAETFLQSRLREREELLLVNYFDKESFQNFYVFGGKNNFVIVAADDCVQPILGYSTTNPFGTGQMPDNLFEWLKGYNDQIADAAREGQRATKEISEEWSQLAAGIAPLAKDNPEFLIKTTWDQRQPYNSLCPAGNCTGCVATAMAQIMRYWSWPATGFGSHSYTPTTHPEYGEQSVNFGTMEYDWDNMTETYSSSSTNAEKAAVATLMYHCGVSVNMDYNSDGAGSSGAYTSDVVLALQNYFNYSPTAQYVTKSSYSDVEWKNLLKQEIDNQRPMQYRGTGHSFICDGYDESTNKFHFNWGWSGQSNGFFPLASLKPTGHNFTQGQAAIIGIKPITNLSQPTHLTGSSANHTVNLNWDAVENASSYYVYRDYNFIGETTSTSYSDTYVTFGEHSYFVRSLDAEENVSLPSNILTVNLAFSNTIEDLTIDYLEVDYENGNATLEWSVPYRLNYLDYYTFEGNSYYWGPGAPEDFYWGTRFPASVLPSSTTLTSVSTFFKTEGQYTINIYQCTGGIPTGSPVATTTSTFKDGWNTINITPAVTIDNQNDLWIVFKTTDIVWNLIVGDQNADDGNYYSSDGTHWNHLTGYSYFISANLYNGNFTYTIYDNGQNVTSGLNNSTHTLFNLSSNTAYQYTVKAQMNNQLGAPSNMAGLTIGTASLGTLNLGENDQMTITENSKLTVSGTLTNTDPDNLVLENGAQLIHYSDSVAATVKKDITHYTSNNDGWYFIASPVIDSITPSENNGLLTNTYDLYRFDQDSIDSEWQNFKAHNNDTENPFNSLVFGQGYLYANSGDPTLSFEGTLAANADATSLVYNGNAAYPGFNLIGNPYPCNATIGRDFYVISGNMVILAETGAEIAPCEGVFVKATETGESVTFTKVTSAKGTISSHCLDLVVTNNSKNGVSTNPTTVDRARVRFGESIGMEKFTLDDKHTQISLWQNGQDFAVAYTDGTTEMPVSFMASQNGTYTLSIENKGLDLDYLHLIDHMTGADIDLLTTPSYTFEAKTTDYASRFSILLAPICEDAVGDNDMFAYINNGNIVINQEGTLQIVDMTGRMVVSRSGRIQSIPTTEMAPGVYVIRLIGSEKIRTQKIVIE